MADARHDLWEGSEPLDIGGHDILSFLDEW